MSTEDYFKSYADLEVHRLMLSDLPRTESYRDAILKNKHYIQNKVVMDVGAGSGILSLFCMQAGAKKVFAIEASPLANVLKEIVKLNDGEKVIEVMKRRKNTLFESKILSVILLLRAGYS